MRYHIIGPMSGIDHYNFSSFADAVAEIILTIPPEKFDSVTTPFTACNTVWNRHHNRDFDPYEDHCEYGDKLMKEMLEEDVKLIMRADIIVLLPHWPISHGTRNELVIAEYLGKPVLDAKNLEPLNVAYSVTILNRLFEDSKDGSNTQEVSGATSSEGSDLVQQRIRAQARGNQA